MRLISVFHDFYDSVQGIDLDYELIYNRKVVEEPLFFDLPTIRPWIWNEPLDYECFILGFCGEIYALLKIVKNTYKKPLKSYEPTFCYNVNEIDELIKNHYREKEFDSYLIKSKKIWKSSKYWGYYCRREIFEKFFRECAEQKSKCTDLFLKYPVFVIKHLGRSTRVIEYNICLKDYEFQRKKDPYTAWMEISMFLNNIAKPEPKIPEISDIDMVSIKGFDPKYSFRKDKSKNG